MNLFSEPRIRDGSSEDVLVIKVNAGAEVTDRNAMRQLPGLKGSKTPTSDYLFQLLRQPLREFLPDDVAYRRCFDRFEYLLGLVYVDLSDTAWAPVGCFIWRDAFFRRPRDSVGAQLNAQADQAGADWPALKAGLFKGSVERFKVVHEAYQKFIAEVAPSLAFG